MKNMKNNNLSLELDSFSNNKNLEKGFDVIQKAKGLPVGTVNKYGEVKQSDGTWKYQKGAYKGVAEGEGQGVQEGVIEDHTHLEKDVETIARSMKDPMEKVEELVDLGVHDTDKLAMLSHADRSDVAKLMMEKGVENQRSNINPDKFKNLLPKVDVEARWKSYRVFLNMLAKPASGIKSMIAYGTGGVGKTYTLNKVFEGHKLKEFGPGDIPGFGDYDFVKITGKSTPTHMYKALFEHNGKTIVFDDCDSVLEDDTAINILKGALDTTGDGTIVYGSAVKLKDADGEPIPQRFQFKGKVAFVSNLTPDQMPQPLRSRALTVDLSMTADETVTMLRQIAPVMPFQNARGEVVKVSQEDRLAAVDFIDKYKNQIDIGDLNARTLGQIALLRKEFNSNEDIGLPWEQMAITMLS